MLIVIGVEVVIGGRLPMGGP